MPPIIDKEKCTGCHTCVTVCSADVYGHQKPGTKVPVIRFADECWACNACVVDCPASAIHLRIPMPAMMAFMEPLKRESATVPQKDAGK